MRGERRMRGGKKMNEEPKTKNEDSLSVEATL